jgi:hypothetical protein
VYVRSDFSVLSYLPTVIADLVLLLIILAGLLILRHGGGGMFGLTRLLWNQVRWCGVVVFTDCSFFFLFTSLILFFHKGVIWLVLGTAIVVPPVVSAANLSFFPFCLYPVCVVGTHYVAFEWYFSLYL